MTKTFRAAAIAVAVCLALCGCGQNSNDPSDKTMGTVTIISGGEEYLPLENWVFSYEEGLASDGARLQPREAADKLTAIPCGDDLQIVITGEPWENRSYTLYNSQLEEVYYRGADFTFPRDKGEYILFIELIWGNEEYYSGYQYCFKLIV